MWPNMEKAKIDEFLTLRLSQLISPKGAFGEKPAKKKADFFLKIQFPIECTWF